jgi:hypothetical protein
MSSPHGKEKSRRAKTPSSRPLAWKGPAIILVAAMVALGPLFLRGPSCTSDFGFHFISWIDAQHSMSTGLLYPHWAESPNFGAGEPRFVFYPPISWMSGALLGMFLPWSLVPLVLYLLLLTATGLASRALAGEVLPDQPATLAGCASIFLGYVLFSVYRRNDFAELAGAIWVPLLLLFALRRQNSSGNFWQRTFDGSATPLAIMMAGVWLSNGPVAIMACYLLAAVVLVSALVEKSLVPVVRAAIGTLGGIGLASIYLIPAVCERNWISIENAIHPGNYVVENSWLFARHADPLLASHDIMLHRVSMVAVEMFAVAFGGGAIAWMRGFVPGERRWWLPLALIPPAILFLLLPISRPVWNLLPELRLLQFPWRWLLILEAPMSICFAAAVWSSRKSLRIPLMTACAAIFVAISLAAPHWWFVEGGTRISSIEESWKQDIGVPGKPEYAPPGIRDSQPDILVDEQGNPLLDSLGDVQEKALAHAGLQFVPAACLLDGLPHPAGQETTAFAPAWRGQPASCNSSGWRELVLMSSLSHAQASRHKPEERWIDGVAPHAGYLILRLRYYPAWRVRVNGILVRTVAERERGLMAVPVPRGNVQVTVDWMTTRDVVTGRWISFLSLILVAGLFVCERKWLPDAHPKREALQNV